MKIIARKNMKIGRKVAAEILTFQGNTQALLITRSMSDIVRGRGNRLISHALQEETACWPVESLLLSRMKRLEIPLLIIYVRQSKTYHISRFSDWVTESEIFRGKRRNGSVQRMLSLILFKSTKAKIKI